jgi:hypothetical protein
MERRWEIDMLRGVMLVMMFCTHLPTRFASPLGQPFGYVSAAEGFIMLSAFMAGMVYSRQAEKNGIPAMRRAFFNRVVTIYACQATLLIFLFSAVAALALKLDQAALTGMLDYYFKNPSAALAGALLLVYNPPLLDILPLYIVLMLLSPFVLAWGIKHGWKGILIVSTALWTCAQFKFSEMLYGKLVSLTGFPVPFSETGAFETYAWQALWTFGLWMGARTKGPQQNRKPFAFPAPLVIAAAMVTAICFVWRHVAGQIAVPGDVGYLINRLFDKWHLGPLRLINFFSLLVLVLHYADWLKAHVPRMRFLENLGAASLPVFCTHLVFVLLALAVAGEYRPGRPLWIDLLLLASGLATLYATARVTLRLGKATRTPLAVHKVPVPVCPNTQVQEININQLE